MTNFPDIADRSIHFSLVFSCISGVAQPRTEMPEQQLFQAINRERAAQGLPPLKWDDALANAARQHAS